MTWLSRKPDKDSATAFCIRTEASCNISETNIGTWVLSGVHVSITVVVELVGGVIVVVTIVVVAVVGGVEVTGVAVTGGGVKIVLTGGGGVGVVDTPVDR